MRSGLLPDALACGGRCPSARLLDEKWLLPDALVAVAVRLLYVPGEEERASRR